MGPLMSDREMNMDVKSGDAFASPVEGKCARHR